MVPEQTLQQELKAEPGNVRKRILIADDNRSLLVVLNTALSARYDVRMVTDGVSLEKELRQRDYDLVISDLNLPYRCGATVLRRLNESPPRAERQRPAVKVKTLVITGLDCRDPEVQSVLRLENVVGILRKPLDTERLRNIVGVLMEEKIKPVEEERPVPKGRDLPRALILSGDPETSRLLSQAFEQHGFQARVCGSAEYVKDLCRQFHFELLVLDFMVEDLCADEVLEQFREAPAEQRPAVLILSALGDALCLDQPRWSHLTLGAVPKSASLSRMVRRGLELIRARAEAAAH